MREGLNSLLNRALIFLVALFCFYSCNEKGGHELVHLQGQTMGTTYNVKYVPSKSFPVDKIVVQKKIDKILVDFNLVASTYDPNSEISKINNLGNGINVSLSSVFKILMNEAIQLNKLSEGVFDPSLSPLINLWGFGAEGKVKSIPSDKEIAQRLKISGMMNFVYDGNGLKKKYSDSALDFSAFAKGYGVDLLAYYLESLQMDDYFIEIGGEVRTRTTQRDWRIGIEKPDDSSRGSLTKIIKLNGCLATSGDYRNFYTIAGKKYSHGINFRSGRPVENEIASVSVFHPSSVMRADGWATTLMVSNSFVDALDLINKNNLAAFIIYREKDNLKMFESPQWKKEFGND